MIGKGGGGGKSGDGGWGSGGSWGGGGSDADGSSSAGALGSNAAPFKAPPPFQAPLGRNRALQARVRQLRQARAIHCCDKHGLLSDFLHWTDIREIAHASWHSYARAIIFVEGRRNRIAGSKERSRSRGLPAADGAAAAEK